MSTTFREFFFENQSDLNVKLILESPVGTLIKQIDVAAKGKVTLYPNVNDVQIAKVRVVAPESHPDYEDVETFKLDGSPYPMYVETLRAQFITIGTIHGAVSAVF